MIKRGAPEDIPADLATLVRIGTVTAVDLASARCTVRYGDPDDDEPGETPPIRWLTARAGATRVWSPPSIGEQVLLLSPGGQVGSAIALTGIVQDAFPALGSSEAEMIEFADGARITYDAQAGALTAILPAGATAEIEAPGGIILRGPVTIEGDVTIEGAVDVSETVTAADDVIAAGKSLKSHRHTAVAAGSSQSGPPA
jgi:phage baseplate assembly protein V